MKKLIPADTVDASGNVWETTGENIRHGIKDFSERDAKMIVDMLFPVGSIYVGENSFIFSVGKWEQIVSNGGQPAFLGEAGITGTSITRPEYSLLQTNRRYTLIRLFKRVS